LPLSAPPVEKFVPVEVVLLVQAQTRFDVPPEETEVGLAVREAVGAAGVTVTVAFAGAEVPPAPVQVTE
jgi:hypothetical protein